MRQLLRRICAAALILSTPASAQQMLAGPGAPANSTGNEGQYYFNTTTANIYGPKSTGTWPAFTTPGYPGGGSIVFPQTISGTTNSGGIPYFSSSTVLSSSAALAANALVIGGGAGAAPATTTTGLNVLTALGITTENSGAFVRQNGAITAGNCLKWSTTGIQDNGSACGGGGGLTVGTTTTASGAAGQIMFDTGAVLQESSGLVWDNTNKALSTLGGGVVTTSNPVINATQTWNAGAVAFSGIKLNVTDTASAATSLFEDLQVGGVQKAAILKTGEFASSLDSVGTVALSWGGAGGSSRYIGSINNGLGFWTAASSTYVLEPQAASSARAWGLHQLGAFGFAGSGGADQALDTLFTRGGAATLQFGAADAAAPVAQNLQVQSVVAGTTSVAGGNWTLTGSKSTGAVVGGDIIFKTSQANAAATVQNPTNTILTLKSSAAANTNPGRILAAGQIESSGSPPTAAGAGGTCATTTVVGGANAGTVVLSGVCAATNTVTLTFKTASATGWACFAANRNTPATLLIETSTTTTTAVLTVSGTSSVAADVMQYACTAY